MKFSAAFIFFLLIIPSGAYARPAVVPMDKPAALGLPDFGGETKNLPVGEEKVTVKKEGISESVMAKKELLVSLSEPKEGVTGRSFQRISGKVGGGIAKVFLRVNDDTQVVSAKDGLFEAYAAMKPGMNSVTVIAWDLEGNLGKDSLKIFYKKPEGGQTVKITAPKDGFSKDITTDRVILVEAKSSDTSSTEGYLVVNNIPRRVSFDKGQLRQEVALLPGPNIIIVEAIGKDGKASISGPVTVRTFDARPKDMLAVLTWDSPAADLDLHVWDSFGHHTFNEATDPDLSEAAIPAGRLDMDRKGGYGPEVFSLEDSSQEVYALYVKLSPGLKEKGATCAYLRVLLHGDEPARRIMRSFGPQPLDEKTPVWPAASVKMPEGVFFQEKDIDLSRTLSMDARAVKRLALMLEEENAAFRLLAISAMGQIKSEDAVGPLVAALADKDPEIRRACVGALRNIKSIKSFDALMKTLKDPDPEVRRTAAGALGAIGDRAAIGSLTGLLAEESDTAVKVEVIRALGQMGEKIAFGSVLPQLRDEDPAVRVEAARTLGALGEPLAEKPLIEVLSDGGPELRETAAEALGRLGLANSVKPLMDALHFDKSEGVRVQAAVALGKIKGQAGVEELRFASEKDGSARVRTRAKKALEGIENIIKEPSLPPIKLDDDVIIY
ncbi:MAG TPA: HEAT repeat domain-containing protein [Nitrospirota bacterium]